jgi:translation initiation factor 2B subunit (eIF-2B alpha/beta/delta family)
MDIDLIIKDNHSGSMTLLQNMLKQLEEELVSVKDDKTPDIGALYEKISEFVKEVVKNQPNMANIRRYGFSFTNHFKKLLLQEVKAADIITDLSQTLISIKKEIEDNVQTISRHITKIITHMPKVMTISNSTLVRLSFDEAIAQNKKLEVTCLKSHPPDEGVILAEYLSQFDVRVRIASDFEVGLFMDDINFVLIGADRILEDEIINKSGTLPLCLTAQYFNIPVYLVSETAKILLEQNRAVKFRKRDAAEIYENTDNEIIVDNFYYERVPLKYIDKIICEEGIFDSEEFKKWYLKG